jgi:lipopolysaccharide heptosyltransferase II
MVLSAPRILIFNVNWLGDVLFSTAAIRAIRENFPGSFIACVIPSGCAAVLEGNPRLNEVIFFDERSTHRGAWAKLCFIRMLRAKKFDAAYLLHRSMTRALICRLAGIRQIIGYVTKKRRYLLTKKIPLISPDAQHRIDYYLNIVQEAGLRVQDRHTEFYCSDADKKKADDFLARHGIGASDFVVGINAGGNWDPKRWPKENWALLADRLITELGAKVVITGGPKDIALAGQIQTLMKQTLIIAAGALSLKEFAALSLRCACFISADTGPLHIANAAGAKRLIGLFGPTSVAVTGIVPADNAVMLHKDVGCAVPCYEVLCPDNRCMNAISVDEVVRQVQKLRDKV